MAKDFAKTSGAKKKPPAKKSAAAKKPARKTGAVKRKPTASNTQGPPTWLVFVTGVATGFFAAFLIYLTALAPTNTTVETTKPEIAKTKPAEKPKEAHAPKKIDFKFYEMLKEQEVEVEASPIVQERSQEETKYIYMLQVASFRNLSDADRLKASLILEQGMSVNIRTINGDNGTWHKVIAGPFETRSKLASARSVLAQKGFNAMELKRPISN